MTDETNGVPYEPLFARVLIERELTTKTASGIIMPTNTSKKYAKCEGIVRAVGPASDCVSVGDQVIFGRYAGMWLTTDGSEIEAGDDNAKWFICNDEDILVKVRT